MAREKCPVHGTSGTTGSEDCLLLYSGTGKSLIFPVSFVSLAKFEAGKPGGESDSALLYSSALTQFFPGNVGGESGSAAVYQCFLGASRESGAPSHSSGHWH